MTDKTKVVIVVAMTRNKRAIGHKNELIWHIPDDLKRFKEKTKGHPIIMGRKTFQSIVASLGTPLPDRTNIVVTRNKDFSYEGVIVCTSFEEALEKGKELDADEVHIGGGAELYTQALPYTDTLFVTYIDDEAKEADTFFPAFETEFAVIVEHAVRNHNGLLYQFVDLERITSHE